MKPANTKFLKWAALGFGVFSVLVVVIALAINHFVTERELCTHFDRLKPGMTYAEVIQLIPPGMIHTDKEPCTSAGLDAALMRSNTLPVYEVRCHGPLDPLLGIEAGECLFRPKGSTHRNILQLQRCRERIILETQMGAARMNWLWKPVPPKTRLRMLAAAMIASAVLGTLLALLAEIFGWGIRH